MIKQYVFCFTLFALFIALTEPLPAQDREIPLASNAPFNLAAPVEGAKRSKPTFRKDDALHLLGGLFAGSLGAAAAFTFADLKDGGPAAASSALLAAFTVGLAKEALIDLGARGSVFDSRDLGWTVAGGLLVAWAGIGISMAMKDGTVGKYAFPILCVATGIPVTAMLLDQLAAPPEEGGEKAAISASRP
jgi:hypothetical protein